MSSAAEVRWGRRAPADGSVPVRGTARRRPDWMIVLPAGVTLMVMLAGIAGPSYWRDETATVSAVSRSLPDLLRMLSHVDTVHGTYYLLVWPLAQLFGTGEVVLRLPSAIAMSLASLAISATVSKVRSRQAGLLAGLVFASYPVISSTGQEARSYAMVIAMAVLSSYLLLAVIEQPGSRQLTRYVLAVALLGYLNVVGLLLLAAHGLTVARCSRPLLTRRWAIAAAIAVMAVTPVLALGWFQRGQVDWLGSPGMKTVSKFALELGAGTVLSAVGIAVLGTLGAVCADSPAQRPAAQRLPKDGLAWLCLPWLVVPPLILLAMSQVVPLFVDRYVLFCLPPAAMLAGAGLAALGPAWRLGAFALLAVLVLPQQRAVRLPSGHGDDFRTAAQFLNSAARPTDAIIFQARRHCTYCIPDWAFAYPYGFTKPRDIGWQESAVQARDLSGRVVSFPVLQARLRSYQRVWVAKFNSHSPVSGVFPQGQFGLGRSWKFRGVRIYLYLRQQHGPVPPPVTKRS